MDAELSNRLSEIEKSLKKIQEDILKLTEKQANNFYTLNNSVLKAISNAVREIKS